MAALIYWPIVAAWTAIAVLTCAILVHPNTKGSGLRILLIFIFIDSVRNILENVYFGLLWGGRYGLLRSDVADRLSSPELLILPKILNIVAAAGILALLALRYFPQLIQDRKRVESDLLDAEWRFRMLVDGVKEYAIYMLDKDGFVTSWNPGAERIKGYSAEEAIGLHVSSFYTAADRQKGRPARALSRASRDGQYEVRGERVRKDGSVFWANIVVSAIYDDDGKVVGFAKVTKDITEAQAAQRILEHQAEHDALTGLRNRARLYADLGAALKREEEVGVAIFDLDGFKAINDTQGHVVGDQLLKKVAKRIAAKVGNSASLYRLGGDEFVILTNCSGQTGELARCVERVLQGFDNPFCVENSGYLIGASAGMASTSGPIDAELLVANADLALYDAKSEGGHRATAFEPAMRARAHARRDLDVALRRAVENGEFLLHFQPQVRLSDGVLVGAEALIRWDHPEQGLVGPDDFIAALAHSDVALDCGNWVVGEACRTLADWREQGLRPVRMAINLFPAQFRDVELENIIRSALASHDVPGNLLEIEITENIALHQDERVIASLQRLRTLGVQLAFDDFGTGYASLSCLTRYPLSRIKLDRSFIVPLSGDDGSPEAAIVRPIVTMAHYLGLGVIAEGVETPDQVRFLTSLGCEEGQGYYFSRPVSAEVFESLLRQTGPVLPADVAELRDNKR